MPFLTAVAVASRSALARAAAGHPAPVLVSVPSAVVVASTGSGLPAISPDLLVGKNPASYIHSYLCNREIFMGYRDQSRFN